MKKFVNDPRQFVPEFLEGIQLASGGALKYEPKYNLIYQSFGFKASFLDPEAGEQLSLTKTLVPDGIAS